MKMTCRLMTFLALCCIARPALAEPSLHCPLLVIGPVVDATDGTPVQGARWFAWTDTNPEVQLIPRLDEGAVGSVIEGSVFGDLSASDAALAGTGLNVLVETRDENGGLFAFARTERSQGLTRLSETSLLRVPALSVSLRRSAVTLSLDLPDWQAISGGDMVANGIEAWRLMRSADGESFVEVARSDSAEEDRLLDTPPRGRWEYALGVVFSGGVEGTVLGPAVSVDTSRLGYRRDLSLRSFRRLGGDSRRR